MYAACDWLDKADMNRFCRAHAMPGPAAEFAAAETAHFHRAGSSNRADSGLTDAVVAMSSSQVQRQRLELAALRV